MGVQRYATNTGTVIYLNNINGTLYNMSSANSATIYTTSGTTPDSWAVVRINAASEPTITGGTKISGATFAANTDMHMFVQYLGTSVQFFFAAL